jgi:hypothetical protein
MLQNAMSGMTRRNVLGIAASMVMIWFVAAAGDPVAAQTGQSENWAVKMFKSTSHDFRAVGRGTKCEYYFDFTNMYEEDVHVLAVRSSCGCTTPTVTKDLLKTHEKASVVAKFNTSTFVGDKEATVTVVFDRPVYAEVQLSVKGFIRTDITFDPPEVAFGEIASGSETEQDIVITHTGNPNWQITDVRSHCDDLEVQLSPPTKSAGMVRYRMRVNVMASMPEGDVRERLTLISNDKDFPTTEMSINGRIRPLLRVAPSAYSFGSTTPGGIVEKRLTISGDAPFAITGVICSDPRFEFETPSGTKRVHFVNLRFTAGAQPDRVGQEIQIKTDLKGGKSVKCVVTGAIE